MAKIITWINDDCKIKRNIKRKERKREIESIENVSFWWMIECDE